MKRLFLATLLLFTACAPAAAPVANQQVVKVSASAATQRWLAETYNCGQGLQIIIANNNDPQEADLALRLGEPEQLKSAAYQIGQDDILVISAADSPLQELTREQARALFAGQDGQSAQILVFAAGEDIQQVFAREVMQGAKISSLAQVAADPQQMLDLLIKDKNSIGILPRRWKTGAVRELFSLGSVPVLALAKSAPQGAVKELLACLQK